MVRAIINQTYETRMWNDVRKSHWNIQKTLKLVRTFPPIPLKKGKGKSYGILVVVSKYAREIAKLSTFTLHLMEKIRDDNWRRFKLCQFFATHPELPWKCLQRKESDKIFEPRMIPIQKRERWLR